MADVERIQVHPLLAEVPLDDGVRVGIVSLTVVAPDHLALRLTTVHADRDAAWVLPMLNVSCDDGPQLQPLGSGGGGGDGWMCWDADFLGRVGDPVQVVEITLVDRTSAAAVATASVTPRLMSPDVDYGVIDNAHPSLTEHHTLVPLSVTPVRSAIEGVDNHVVVSIEHWPHWSVVLVYTPDEHQQIPSVATSAVGRDSLGRTYDVRLEGGGTWCGGAAAHLRVTPRLPGDVDALHLDWDGPPFDVAPVTLRLGRG